MNVIIGLLLIAILIVLIIGTIKGNWDYAKYCEMQEKYEKEKAKRIYWQKRAENPPQNLHIKFIGDFTANEMNLRK